MFRVAVNERPDKGFSDHVTVAFPRTQAALSEQNQSFNGLFNVCVHTSHIVTPHCHTTNPQMFKSKCDPKTAMLA